MPCELTRSIGHRRLRRVAVSGQGVLDHSLVDNGDLGPAAEGDENVALGSLGRLGGKNAARGHTAHNVADLDRGK